MSERSEAYRDQRVARKLAEVVANLTAKAETAQRAREQTDGWQELIQDPEWAEIQAAWRAATDERERGEIRLRMAALCRDYGVPTGTTPKPINTHERLLAMIERRTVAEETAGRVAALAGMASRSEEEQARTVLRDALKQAGEGALLTPDLDAAPIIALARLKAWCKAAESTSAGPALKADAIPAPATVAPAEPPAAPVQATGGFLSPRDLAMKHGVDADALRKRLERWRYRCFRCHIPPEPNSTCGRPSTA